MSVPLLFPEPHTVVAVDSAAGVQEAVRNSAPNSSRLLIRGGGSKTALSRPLGGTEVLDLSGLSGILEYDPGEFVISALAGTPLAVVEAELARHGQYLPFNPPLSGCGATLGGTIAAGLSGAGRQRYGGLRDFLIGAHYVDGQGRLVRSGGKVVKNAAGFDQHKLLIGSLGRLGVVVDVSFKVFPQPPAYGTLRLDVASAAEGVTLLRRLATTRFDLEALDLSVGEEGASVRVRLGGPRAVLPQRLQMLQGWLGSGAVDPEAEKMYWPQGDTFGWYPHGMAGWSLVKVPVTLDRIVSLDGMLAQRGALRRYCSGGNLAWIGWPGDLGDLHTHLLRMGLNGLVLLGETETPILGVRNGENLARRVKATLDPHGKFLELA
jgi:glycolate oxidase FAD binding subunit